MPNRGKHGKARAAAAEAREDIMSSAALSAMSAGAVSAMGTVGAAVIKLHKETLDKKPEWFWHMFAKCEAKAARIAAQAASLRRSCAGKSGNPWARLMAPCSLATRVISRITDSVNCAALWEMGLLNISMLWEGAPVASAQMFQWNARARRQQNQDPQTEKAERR